MRTIKFRIWDKQLKAFLYRLPEKHHLDWERFDVQQFTGLLDSKGKEVYEGDIAQIIDGGETEVYEIKWQGEYDYAAFELDKWEGECNGLAEAVACPEIEIEVIGNIYENEELI